MRESAVRLPVLQAEVLGAPTKEEIAAAQAQRPRTRGDCLGGPRPCPWVSCKHHLLWESRAAWLRGKFGRAHGRYITRKAQPDEVLLDLLWDLPESCALDIADRGGDILEVAGQVLGLVRERVRQVEDVALDRLYLRAKQAGLEPYPVDLPGNEIDPGYAETEDLE
jgi:hypothetical protein